MIFKEKCILKKAVNISVITSLVTLVCGKASSRIFAPKEDFTYQAGIECPSVGPEAHLVDSEMCKKIPTKKCHRVDHILTF